MLERPRVPSSFALLDQLPLPAYVSDATGVTVYANPALTAHTGLSAETLSGHGFAELFHPEDRGPALAVWTHAWRHHEPVEHQARLRVTGGRYRWHQIQSRPSFSGEQLAYIIGTLHDIHALKAAEQRAERLQHLTLRLSGAQTVAEVGAALSHFAQALDAPRAGLSVLRGQELHLVHAVGYEDALLTRWQTLPLDADLPTGEALRSGKLRLLSSEAFAAHLPHRTRSGAEPEPTPAEETGTVAAAKRTGQPDRTRDERRSGGPALPPTPSRSRRSSLTASRWGCSAWASRVRTT